LRRYERPGHADLGRRKETRDQHDGNLLLKKEVRVSELPGDEAVTDRLNTAASPG